MNVCILHSRMRMQFGVHSRERADRELAERSLQELFALECIRFGSLHAVRIGIGIGIRR